MPRRTRNINGEGSRKTMPDGRVAFRQMVGYREDGKPNIVEVIQRKNETIKDLKKRFQNKVALAKSLPAGKDNELFNAMSKGGQLTLGEWLDEWMKNYKKNTVKPNTYAFYNNLIKKHIVPKLGSVALSDIKPLVLQNCCNNMLESGLSHRTVKGVAQIFHAALSEAWIDNLISANPGEKIKIVRDYSIKKEIQAFTREEEMIFLKAVKDTYHEVFFVTALNTGMRIGEILGLQWEDIDFNNNVINVRHNLVIVHNYKTSQQVILGTPKTAAGVRTIPVTNTLKEALQKHKQLHIKLFNKAEGYVFKTNSGMEYHSRTSFDKELKRICKENNLPMITMHALRHSFATRGLEAGIQPRVMQKLLGHADWNMFYNTYSHVMKGIQDVEQEKLVEALDKITSDKI